MPRYSFLKNPLRLSLYKDTQRHESFKKTGLEVGFQTNLFKAHYTILTRFTERKIMKETHGNLDYVIDVSGESVGANEYAFKVNFPPRDKSAVMARSVHAQMLVLKQSLIDGGQENYFRHCTAIIMGRLSDEALALIKRHLGHIFGKVKYQK